MEESIEIASAVKNADDHDPVFGDLKNDGDAAFETDDAQAGHKIVAARAALGKRLEAFALRLDAPDKLNGDLRRSIPVPNKRVDRIEIAPRLILKDKIMGHAPSFPARGRL